MRRQVLADGWPGPDIRIDGAVGRGYPGAPSSPHLVAFSAWASYSALCLLGLIHPLKMLAIMIFVIGYKVLWLAIVPYPLWRANALAGSPAEAMTRVFLWVPLMIIAVPWGYVFRNYVMWSRKRLVS